MSEPEEASKPFRTYAEIRDNPEPSDQGFDEIMAHVKQLTGQKEETE